MSIFKISQKESGKDGIVSEINTKNVILYQIILWNISKLPIQKTLLNLRDFFIPDYEIGYK
jgi:hypothetical protein